MKRLLRGRSTTVAALVAVSLMCLPASALAADRCAGPAVHRSGKPAFLLQTREVSCQANTTCRDSSWGG